MTKIDPELRIKYLTKAERTVGVVTRCDIWNCLLCDAISYNRKYPAVACDQCKQTSMSVDFSSVYPLRETGCGNVYGRCVYCTLTIEALGYCAVSPPESEPPTQRQHDASRSPSEDSSSSSSSWSWSSSDSSDSDSDTSSGGGGAGSDW